MLSESLQSAAADYLWLLDRGYPGTGSLKLVGDKYRLTGAERQMLHRGVSSTALAVSRQSKLAPLSCVRDASVALDGHNVVLTVANYLSGVPVFVANDGLVRDIGSVHGRVRNQEIMSRAIALVVDRVSAYSPEQVHAFLDAPVSHSKRHGELMLELFTANGIETELSLRPSADSAIKYAAATGAIDYAASSDSAVVDAAPVPVIDIARAVLETDFGPVRARFATVEPPEQKSI